MSVRQLVRDLPAEARFAAVPEYNHPLVYCGRKLAMGYAGHLHSQGIDYEPLERDLDTLMRGSARLAGGSRAPGSALRVFWGPREETDTIRIRPCRGPIPTNPWRRATTARYTRSNRSGGGGHPVSDPRWVVTFLRRWLFSPFFANTHNLAVYKGKPSSGNPDSRPMDNVPPTQRRPPSPLRRAESRSALPSQPYPASPADSLTRPAAIPRPTAADAWLVEPELAVVRAHRLPGIAGAHGALSSAQESRSLVFGVMKSSDVYKTAVATPNRANRGSGQRPRTGHSGRGRHGLSLWQASTPAAQHGQCAACSSQFRVRKQKGRSRACGTKSGGDLDLLAR